MIVKLDKTMTDRNIKILILGRSYPRTQKFKSPSDNIQENSNANLSDEIQHLSGMLELITIPRTQVTHRHSHSIKSKAQVLVPDKGLCFLKTINLLPFLVHQYNYIQLSQDSKCPR